MRFISGRVRRARRYLQSFFADLIARRRPVCEAEEAVPFEVEPGGEPGKERL